jgi:hypothetical protein
MGDCLQCEDGSYTKIEPYLKENPAPTGRKWDIRHQNWFRWILVLGVGLQGIRKQFL